MVCIPYYSFKIYDLSDEENERNQKFTGKIFITELDGHFLYGYRVDNGKIVSKLIKNKDAKEASKNSHLITKEALSDCEFTPDGCTLNEIVLAGTGSSSNNNIDVPNVYDFSGAYGTGGNSSGFFYDSNFSWNYGEGSIEECSGGKYYNYNTENCECIDDNKEEDSNGVCVEAATYPYPHCSSFEYYKPPGALVTACAVTNLNDTFYAEGELNGVQGTFEVPVNYPLIYFTMPSWMTNGSAATNTAIAVNNALNATQEWFVNNPQATENQIGDNLDAYLIIEMGKFGGSMSAVPPFPLSNPVPYQTSLFTTGNCN